MKKNGRIRRSIVFVLGAIGMPERLARERGQAKGGKYGFLDALAGDVPVRDASEAGGKTEEAPEKPKPAKVPTDLVETVVAALKVEGLEGDKAMIKEFEASCADEIQYILGESDPTVRGVLMKATAERFAMDKRPAATNSYRRKGVFPIG